MSDKDHIAILHFANRVQRWSLQGAGRRKPWPYGTFGAAAKRFDVTVELISAAVEAHYWMFTHDTGPLADRRIDHDGE